MSDELRDHAKERGFRISRSQAERVLRERGDLGARVYLDSLAALLDLAGALGFEVSVASAFRRLEATGDSYDEAARSLVEQVRSQRRRIFNREWSRLEQAHFAGEARSRHAALFGSLIGGPLGWQAMVLLAAARDAGLQDPSADAYRKQLDTIVKSEIDTRYPDRREADWQVIDPDSRHAAMLDAAMSEEKQAKDLVLAKRPELHQRIDALATSSRMRNDVERVLGRVRRRLSARINTGWSPSPERYRLEVVEAARSAALQPLHETHGRISA